MSGALAACVVMEGVSGNTGPFPDGTVLFDTQGMAPGNWSYTLPASVAFFTGKFWGPGGVGSDTSSGKTIVAGPGGAGGGEAISHSACSGQTLSGILGTPGSNTGAPVNGTATTLNAVAAISLAAVTANPGANGVYGSSAGAGGTATGGSVSNTTGNAGGLTNTWDGGSGANGGGDQTVQGTQGTYPGGGSAGGAPLPAGAQGRVQIIARTS